MKTKVIWHVGGWSNNFGDRALQVATTKIMRDRAPKNTEFRFIYIDNQNTHFSKQLINKLNSEADLLLLGGGGFIFSRPQDKSHSGWQFSIRSEDIDCIKVPIAVYGIGHNQFPYDSDGFKDETWDSIDKIAKKSIAFSVRNNGTYETLEKHGICVDNITVVPDAAVFTEPDEFRHECLNNDKFKIAINWATDRWSQRFGKHDDGESKAYCKLNTVLNVLSNKSREHNSKIYLVEHLMPNPANSDNKKHLKERFRKIIGQDGIIISETLSEDLYPPFDYKAGMFTDVYRQMDITIGMRGHANIVSFGQNTPCIGIGEHNKVKWFLEDVELRNILVPLDKDTEGDIVDLSETIDFVIDNISAIKESMSVKKAQLGIIKNTFVDKIIGGI